MSTFQAVVKENDYVNSIHGEAHVLWEDSFLDEDVLGWVSAMIVRGCSDIEQIFVPSETPASWEALTTML